VEVRGDVKETEHHPPPLSEEWLHKLLFACASLSDEDLVRLAAIAKRVIEESEAKA